MLKSFLALALLFHASAYGQEAHLTGHADGVFVTILLPRAQVQALLPTGLELAPVDNNVHPILMGWMRHTSVARTDAQAQWCPPHKPCDYNEVVYYIPHVTSPLFPGKAFGYMPKLYLDQIGPIMIGNVDYHYKKEAAFISNADTYEVKDIWGKTLFHAKTSEVTDIDAEGLGRSLNQMAPVFAQAGITEKDGKLSCVTMRYDLTSAIFTPVNVKLELFGSKEVPIKGEFLAPGLDKSVVGGYRLQGDWIHSNAFDCSSLP